METGQGLQTLSKNPNDCRYLEKKEKGTSVSDQNVRIRLRCKPFDGLLNKSIDAKLMELAPPSVFRVS